MPKEGPHAGLTFTSRPEGMSDVYMTTREKLKGNGD